MKIEAHSFAQHPNKPIEENKFFLRLTDSEGTVCWYLMVEHDWFTIDGVHLEAQFQREKAKEEAVETLQ